MAKKPVPTGGLSKLAEKMLAASTIKDTALISESRFFKEKDVVRTEVPMINVALSGRMFEGGLVPGSTMLAAPSKHFKSGFALLLARAFLRKYPDGMILFYDSEFGSPESYFTSFGIQGTSVIHSPINSVEDLKHDIVVQLEAIDRDDHVLILVDSLGNAPSNKEVEDALSGKAVADMTRAKAIKSLFRTISTKLVMKDVPLIVVNHTYQTLEMFAKTVVGGGTGSYYGADNIWVISRQQDKNEKTKRIEGYNFVIKIEKSRYCQEGTKIPISISFDGGINKWSGLLDNAIEAGYVGQPKKGYYSLINQDTNEFEEELYKEDGIIDNDAIWTKLTGEPGFVKFIEDKYKLSNAPLLKEEGVVEDETA
jgi:hypothetical protein